ncbi:hypothetical protein M9Y10_019774 [Tritrichomonas musculus]|uniref:Protein kinase domain-containing protein n=1 Tax=Tritrichomonas musculus TaxID=1915356 RepID=A0ABR2HI57_9EUKA
MNNDITQLNKYSIDLNKYKFIEEIKSDCFQIINIIQEKENGKKFAATTSFVNDDIHIKHYILREINTLVHIQHSTIIRFQGFSNQDNNVIIITNYVDNKPLSNFLEKDMQSLLPSDFNNTKKQIILVGIAYGMMILHQHNVIHGDLKPENILLDNDYKPVLANFSFSKIFNPYFSMSPSTAFYMAPEIAISNNYSTKSDVFSFGILMYEIVTGSRAYESRFGNPNYFQCQFQKEVIEGLRPDFYAPTKEGLKKLIQKCWSNNPDERPSFSQIFDKLSLRSDSNENTNCCLDDVDLEELFLYVEEITEERATEKERADENDEESLLNFEELCHQIFSHDKNNLVVPQDLNEDSKKLVVLLLKLFPDDSVIKSILKTKTFDETIKSFVFPICNSHLENICTNKELFEYQSVFEIFALFTFYAWISIHLILQNQQKFDISVLLFILNFMIHISTNDEQKVRYRNISISCFVDIIKTAVQSGSIDNYQTIFKAVSDFFVKNKNLPKNSDEIINVLFHKLLTPNNGLNGEETELIDMTNSIIDQNPDSIGQKVVLSIIKLTKGFIINLNPIFLKLFLHFANYIKMDDFILIFKPVIIQMLANVVSFHKNNLKTNDKEAQKIEKNDSIEIFCPPDDLYQIDKSNIDDLNAMVSFDTKDLSSFISPEILPIVLIIEQIINLDENFAKYFITEATENLQSIDDNLTSNKKKEDGFILSKSIFYEQCAIVFYLLSSSFKKFSGITIEEKSALLFNNKRIFDPKITYFSQNAYFDVINALRDFIFQLLIVNYPTLLSKILKENLDFPFLTRENVCRIMAMQKKDQKSEINFKLSFLADSLIECLIKYRMQNFNENDDFILSIRKMIFCYFRSYLQDDSNLAVVFCSLDFISSFFALLIEPPIRQQFIGFLNKYLLSNEFNQTFDSYKNNVILPSLCHSIIKIITVSCNKLSQNEMSSLLSDILKTLNNSISVNESLSYRLLPISKNLCNSLLDKGFVFDEADEVVLHLINFLAATYYEEKLNENDIFLIESTIALFIETNWQDKIILTLVQVIADKQMDEMAPTFEIKNATMLSSLVHIFIKSKSVCKVINFISDLCSYSFDNCAKCQLAELDRLIINIIKEFRTEKIDENAKILIDSFLHLFSKIACVTSSVPVVNSFFSLLCPIDSEYLSPIQKNIIDTLNEILILSKFSPVSALPMLPSSEIQIDNIITDAFDEGMSFTFWISLPSMNSSFMQDIITLHDSENHKLKVKLIDKSLRVIIQSGTIFYSSDFQFSIPNKIWTMITISLAHNSNNQGTTISLYVNKELIKDHYTFTVMIPKSPITCVINRSKQVPEDKNFEPPLIGLFMLSKQLNDDDLSYLNNVGQRSPLSSCENKIVFAYTPDVCDNYLSLVSLKKVDGISESYQKIPVLEKQSKSFASFLTDVCNVDLIVPIFGQLDVPFKDGSKFNSLAELGVEILSNLFILGDQVQNSFYDFKGFFSISYLLQNSDDLHITYELYLKYYNLLKIITNKDLQMQLIDAILMDFNIWSKSEIENQVKIIQHWNKQVYSSYKNLVDMVRSFEWFLISIHRFYESEDRNYLNCRKPFYEIACESFKTDFSSNQISVILGFICLNETMLTEKKEMLSFLIKILSSKQIINDVDMKVSRLIIQLLFSIIELEDKDDDLIIRFISVLLLIYKYKGNWMKIRLTKSIQRFVILLHVNQGYLFHEDIFSTLISLMNANKAVELLPILCVNSILGGSSYLIMLLKRINRKLEYFTCEQSMIYPALLLFAYHQNTYLYNEIIRMNITLFKKNWNNLINAIDIIGLSCFEPNVFDNIKHDVLYRIAIQPKLTPNDVSSLIREIKNFIFFRPEKSQYSILNHALNQDQISSEKVSKESDSDPNTSSDIEIDDEPGIDIGSVIGSLPNSIPNQALNAYNKMKKKMLPGSFHVRFDLDTSGPVTSSNNNTCEMTVSEDDEVNIRTNIDDFKCDRSTIKIFYNLYEIIQNEIKSDISDRPISSKYKYGLRFGDLNDKWLDLDLAKSILSLYKKYNIIQYAEIMNVIALFIYKSDPNFIGKIKKILPEFNTYIDELKKGYNYYLMESQLSTHDDMISHHVLIYANSFFNFYNTSLNDQFFANKIDVKNIMTSFLNKQFDLININANESMKTWGNAWHSLTITEAPWSDSLSKSCNSGFKRDESFCFSCCPHKLKIIVNYDRHLKESMIRDFDDKRKAERRYSMIVHDQQKYPLFCPGFKSENKDTKDKQKSGNNSNKEMLECTLKTIKAEMPVIISIGNKSISITNTSHNNTVCLHPDEINSILYAYKNHKFDGIQIFTKQRENYLLIFSNSMFRILIPRIRQMPNINQSKIQSSNPKPFLNSLHITEVWSNGKMSNFEYLMYLNILSGRSFNDASQYPVFPWIISDYKSPTLDLKNEAVYRDLSKPMGALDSQTLAELMKQRNEAGKSYLYDNCYSYSSLVYDYLVRLEPFTTKHIDENDGKFAKPSEIFNSIDLAFQNSMKKFNELIPEFFFLPEFLRNENGLDLGKIDNKTVGDVILPPWSNNSPFDFIYLNRKALESDFVSSNLSNWIDLIWGYKQNGNEANKANNLFRSELYETVWKQENINESKIKEIQLKFGQIPLKLFDEKHPKRKNFMPSKSSIQIFNSPVTSPHQKSSDFPVHCLTIKSFEVTSTFLADVAVLPQKNKFFFALVDSSLNIFSYTVDFGSLKSQENIVKAKCDKKTIQSQDLNDHLISFVDPRRVCLANSSCLQIVNCQNGLIEKSIDQKFEINSIETTPDGWLAVASKEATVTLYNVYRILNSKPSKPIESSQISSFKENICCIAIGQSFGTAVFATKSGCLLFCQLKLNKMKVNRSIQINGRPKKMIVTDVFGFVIVLLTKIKNDRLIEKVVLFNINGEKIRSTKIEKKTIVAMTKASSLPGCFDFLIVADDSNFIYVFEAFYLQIGEPVFRCNSRIIKLMYNIEESLIVAFCEDGTASIIYYPIIE